MNRFASRLFVVFSVLCLGTGSVATAAPSDVVINEVLYSAGATNSGLEFIELYNRASTEVNVSGWVLGEGVDYTFPSNTFIQAGGYLVVAQDEAAAADFYDVDVLGQYLGRLSNRGDLILLQDASLPRQVIDAFEYTDEAPWPHEADGAGASLELIDPQGDNADATNWGIGQPFTPGEANSPTASDQGVLVITEIHYKPTKRRRMQAIDPINAGVYWKDGDDPSGQFIEILNTGEQSLDLSRWQIVDEGGVLFEFVPGTRIDSGEYIVVCEDAQLVADHYVLDDNTQVFGNFRDLGGLADAGERLTILDELDRVVDTVPYQDSPPWPVGPDQHGVSLECLDPLEPNHRANNWRTGLGYTLSGGGGVMGFSSNNGSFEDGDNGWSKTGNHVGTFHTTADSHDGSAAEHIVATGAGGSSSNSLNRIVSGVSNGSNYTVSMWVKKLSGGNLRFRFSGGSFLTTVVGTGEWQFVETSDDASSDRLYIFLSGAGEWLVDQISIVGNASGTSGIPTTPLPGSLKVGDEVFVLGGTPGGPNSRSSVGLPPFVDRDSMVHSPLKPGSSDTVTIRGQVTGGGGVSAVSLDYEIFRPNYQSLFDGGSIAMRDDGTQGDLVAGDGVYAAQISPQSSKSLVRYRIHADGLNGLSETYPDQFEPNWNRAYYVYNGENDTDLSAYFLIMPSSTLNTLNSNIWTRDFLEATLVVDGIVHDHIGVHYRGRGWRGHPKKSWRVDFNSSESLREMGKLDLAMHFPTMQHTIHQLFFGVGQTNLASEAVRLHVNGTFTGLYLAQESPNRSWLRARGMSGAGEVYKASGAPSYSQRGFSGSIVADLRHFDDDTVYPKIWEKKGDGLGSRASMIALTDIVDNTPSGSLEQALLDNMNVNDWLYNWAIHVMGGNGDIIGTNYTAILPAEPGAKWQMKSFDYSHFFGCKMLDFTDVICNPFTQSPYLYYNKFHDRVRKHPALENRFLAILKDVLESYYTEERMDAILDDSWSRTNTDRSNELALGLPGPGPYVVSAADLNEMKSYHASRRSWLLNSWIPGEGSASVSNEHPRIEVTSMVSRGDDLQIFWSASDPEGNPSTVDLFWYDRLWSYFEPIPGAVDLPASDGSFVWVAPGLDFNERDIFVKATIRDNVATYGLVGHTISTFPVLGEGPVDTTPPELVSASRDRNSTTTVTVRFSESLDATTATDASNYAIDNGVTVLVASQDGSDTVELRVSEALEEPTILTVNRIQDTAGNAIAPNSRISIFIPADLDGPPTEGLALWLAADNGVSTSGSSVTRWDDLSDGRNNGTAVGNPELVKIDFPGGRLPAIRFDGISGFDLANVNDLTLFDISIFAVTQINDSNPSRIIIANYRDVVGYGLGISDSINGRVKWFTASPGDSMEPAAATLTPSEPVILTATFSGGDKQLLVNGEVAGSSSGRALSYGAGNELSVGYLASPAGRQFFVGDIAEILVYDSVDAQQSDAIHSYLSQKYFGAPPPAVDFRRGDVDNNGFLSINDAMNSLQYQFLGSLIPSCLDALDTNDDGKINITDPLVNLFFQFTGGVTIPSPGPFKCGPDPSADGVDCVASSCN